jgi:hypothetical protein
VKKEVFPLVRGQGSVDWCRVAGSYRKGDDMNLLGCDIYFPKAHLFNRHTTDERQLSLLISTPPSISAIKKIDPPSHPLLPVGEGLHLVSHLLSWIPPASGRQDQDRSLMFLAPILDPRGRGALFTAPWTFLHIRGDYGFALPFFRLPFDGN